MGLIDKCLLDLNMYLATKENLLVPSFLACFFVRYWL